MKSTRSRWGLFGRLLRQEDEKRMFGKRIFSFIAFALGLIFLAFPSFSLAQGLNGRTSVEVKNSDGNTVFLLDFWGQNDDDYRPGEKSDWNFTQAQINAITEAAQYWVDIIKPTGEMPLASLPVYDANGLPVYETDSDGNPVIDPDTGQPKQQYSMQQQPVVVRIGNSNDEAGNAYALSMGNVISAGSSINDKDYTVSRPQGIIADGVSVPTAVETPNGDIVENPNGAHALIVVGSGWNAVSGNQSQTGRVAQDLTPVIIHEFGHALGIGVDYYTFEYSNETGEYQFGDVLSRWDSRLRDILGNAAKPGQIVGHAGEYDNQSDYFEMGDTSNAGYFAQLDKPTFVGKNSLELWYGKSIDELTEEQKRYGVPLEGYTNYYGYWLLVGVNGLSHIDTTNGLMSWQGYRNYNGFTEIELAIMQDIGYDIERRNFFGKSYYVDGDGETVQLNTANFGLWTGNGYSTKANTSNYAIGTHLFAKNLNIHQIGSIVADGPGSAGIRIDGSNNKLRIDKNSSIVMGGLNGIGLLAAYGKDHSIIHQGNIKATGVGGIGVSFNFGEPVLGNRRGSYYYLIDAVAEDENYIYSDYGIMPELDGALVKNFDVTGSIIGTKTKSTASYGDADGLERNWLNNKTFHLGAAIHIDETAHVENINIMNGAYLEGDILSFWRGKPSTNLYPDDWLTDSYGNVTDVGASVYGLYSDMDLPTNLTFGLKSATDGSATNVADPDFKITYKDNINYFRYELYPTIVTEWDSQTNTYVPDSPSMESNDTFWHFIAWDDGFYDYQFAGGNMSVTIERDYENNKVYAGVVTPGIIDLKFAGGVTEFVGNRVHVRSMTVDRGATLTLTPDSDDPTRTPQVHIAARDDGWNDDVTVVENSWLHEYNKPVNNGRITGTGEFHVGRETEWSTRNTTYNGHLLNNGTIAPGADNGAGVGTISVYGNLKFTGDSVYEVTLSRILLTDRDGNIVDKNGNYIDKNGNVLDKNGNIIGRDQDPIYVESNDLISVSGETTLAGTLKINVEANSSFDDQYSTYTIIESGSFKAGTNFNNIETDVAFLYFYPELTFKKEKDKVLGQLTAVRDVDYFKKLAETYNELSVATAIDNSLATSPLIAFSLGNKNNSAADLRDMYRQLGASVRANSAMMNLWNPSELVFNHIGWGNGQMETGNRGKVNWNRIHERRSRILGQNPALQRSGSMWFDTFHNNFETENDGDGGKYDFNRTGMMVGGEWNLTPYAAIGAITAYADGTLKQTGDKVESDDYTLGLYFVGAPYNEFEIKTYIGLGVQEYDMNRYVRNANIIYNGNTGINDTYRSDTKGMSFNFSFELARPLMLHPTFILRPTLGIDVQHIWQSGFTENDLSYISPSWGSNFYALSFNRMHYDRTLLRAGFSSETSGCRGGIRMRTFYVTNVGGDDLPFSTQRFATDTNYFDIRGTKIAKNYINLGIGANLWLDGERTSTLFFDYDSNIYTSSKKTYAHSLSIGFTQNF